ncbi:DUF4238 domain-containing protein [Streptomyces sp. NPDC005078]|uniref:DUF4238 domain-containing protein n=1 Tax=Streptomyces sp. NPDC005078 TaxID=3154293 RepID=UPI0033BB042A
MGNNVSRRHHLLPEMWLEGFAQNRKLKVRRRGQDRELLLSCRDATVVGGFYTNPLPSKGEDGQEVEGYLAQMVEGPAAGSLRRIREGHWPLSQGAEEALHRLLAHQITRTWPFRKLQQHIEEHSLPLMTAAEFAPLMEQRLGRILSPFDMHQLEQHFRKNPWLPPDSLDPRRDLTHQLKAADRLQEQITSWAITLLKSDKDRPLLLVADVGVVVRQADGSFSPLPPLLPDDAELLAPVAPHLLLVASACRKPKYRHGRLTPRMAARTNRGAVALCNDAVIRHPGHAWPKGLQLEQEPPGLSAPVVTWAHGAGGATEHSGLVAPTMADEMLAQLVHKLRE